MRIRSLFFFIVPQAARSVSYPHLAVYKRQYDSRLISLLHEMGQRVSYHTCGGMMPFLERIADMGPDAMETFTPPAMGGDADLAQAKRRIGDRVCMIGGFDQFHYLTGCTPQQTREAVRECFRACLLYTSRCV